MTMTSIAQLIIGVTDLGAAFLFMYGLKRMSSPVTAPSGIFVAGLGMLVAVLASFFYVFDVRRGCQATSDRQCRHSASSHSSWAAASPGGPAGKSR